MSYNPDLPLGPMDWSGLGKMMVDYPDGTTHVRRIADFMIVRDAVNGLPLTVWPIPQIDEGEIVLERHGCRPLIVRLTPGQT